jgi:hypothetical protein
MYDIENKSFCGRLETVDRYGKWTNKDYVPFSFLCNLHALKDMSALKYIEEMYNRTDVWRIYRTYETLNSWLNSTPYCPVRLYTGRYVRRDKRTEMDLLVKENLCLFLSNFRGNYRDNLTFGYYTIMDFDMRKVYFMLVVKKEYIKYVKLCILLNKPIEEDCFEFWYDTSYCTTNTQVLRALKKVLKELEEYDIKCIEKTNISELFQANIEFNASTIKEQKMLIEQHIQEFQEQELKRLGLKY